MTRGDTVAKQSAQSMEETRNKIIQVAMELFLSKGIADTTMQQIADGVGISHRTLYRYFKDKDALACTIAVIKRGEIQDIDHATTQVEGTGYQRLRNHIEFLSRYQCTQPVLCISRFLAEYDHYVSFLSSEIENDDLSMLTERYKGLIAEMIRCGQADGSIRSNIDPVSSAGMFVQVYIFTVHRMASRYRGEGHQEPPEKGYLETYFEHYLLAIQGA